jgi:hypothetical protein
MIGCDVPTFAQLMQQEYSIAMLEAGVAFNRKYGADVKE